MAQEEADLWDGRRARGWMHQLGREQAGGLAGGV